MCQQHISKIGLAGAVLATPANASSFEMGEVLETSASVVLQALAAGYRAAPALMLCLIALVVVPLTAAIAATARWWRRRGELALIAQKSANPGEPIDQPRHAALEVLSGSSKQLESARIELTHDMVRIGREEDNDIRIRSKRVHRYHAAIYREDFGIYRIADLAGSEGNGLSINGRTCDEALLRDGDVIELGPGRLRFHAGLV